MPAPAPPPSAAQRTLVPRARARRGNADDHAAMREQILAAAFRLHRDQGGVDGLSMRSLAATVGLSAMGLYGYYENKAALLQAMWEKVLTDALSLTSAAAYKGRTARERMTAGIEAFLGYWESEPDNFRLVFTTSHTLNPTEYSGLTDNPAYQNAVRLGGQLIDEFIEEIGGYPARREEARDLRLALMVGYLHARLINRRFAWSNFDALRRNCVQTIMLGIETCVMRPPEGRQARARR